MEELIKDYYLCSSNNDYLNHSYSSRNFNCKKINKLEYNKHFMGEMDLSKTSIVIPVCKFIPGFIHETILNQKLANIFINAEINNI